MIIYNDALVPKRFAAVTVGTLIIIRPAYKDDIGLQKHEETHVRQFKADLRYAFRYQFSKVWRLKYEAEAYAVQVGYANDQALAQDRFANFLVDKYDLGITKQQAMDAITDALKALTPPPPQ